MLLVHVGQPEAAERVHNAWLRTLEDGVHTYDVFTEGRSREKAGTREFAAAVIARLGKGPETLRPVRYSREAAPRAGRTALSQRPEERKDLVGVDVFLEWRGGSPEDLGRKLVAVPAEGLALQMITNRGVNVWPAGQPETFCSDHWRCRYLAREKGGAVRHEQIAALLRGVALAGLDFIKTENLYTFDGLPGYSTGQGE
jgi:isocitrate dehydrogenase